MSGATHFKMKSTSPDSIQHSRTSGSPRTNSSKARKSASAWLDRCTEANTVTSKPSRRGNTDAFGQLDIGDSAIGLDFAENFKVDLVKILRHAGPSPINFLG